MRAAHRLRGNSAAALPSAKSSIFVLKEKLATRLLYCLFISNDARDDTHDKEVIIACCLCDARFVSMQADTSS